MSAGWGVLQRHEEELAGLADRTFPVDKQILEGNLRWNLVDLVSYGRIVNILAYGTGPFLHGSILLVSG